MGKVTKKKTTTIVKKSVRKKPVRLTYSKTILITMGVLFLTLFLFVFEAQRFQEQRSGAATTNCSVSATAIQMTAEENNLLQLINQYRQSKGAPTLTTSTALNQSAAWMSVDMNSKKLLAHTDSLGRDLQTRLTQCGYTAAGLGAGENVAKGTGTTAQEIFDLWKASTEGHNEEMLNANHKVVGIAQTDFFWTADFGDTADGTGDPAPSGGNSIVTPTFFPLAPCPTCITPAITEPTTAPEINPEPEVSAEPVISGVDEEPEISGVPEKPGHGQGQGGILDIIRLILEFLKHLIELLLGGGNGGGNQ